MPFWGPLYGTLSNNNPVITNQLIPATGPSAPVLLQLNVINGTQWLHLGGSLDTFDLVLGRPPSTSSDLGLAEAVAMAAAGGNLSNSGIVVTFSPQSLVSQLEDRPEICAKMQVTCGSKSDRPYTVSRTKVFSRLRELDPSHDVESRNLGKDSVYTERHFCYLSRVGHLSHAKKGPRSLTYLFQFKCLLR